MNSYDVGNIIVLQANFYSGTPAALVDPTSVKVLVSSPSGPATLFTPTRISKGVYTYLLDLESQGVWQYRWTCSGNIKAAANGALICTPSPI